MTRACPNEHLRASADRQDRRDAVARMVTAALTVTPEGPLGLNCFGGSSSRHAPRQNVTVAAVLIPIQLKKAGGAQRDTRTARRLPLAASGACPAQWRDWPRTVGAVRQRRSRIPLLALRCLAHAFPCGATAFLSHHATYQKQVTFMKARIATVPRGRSDIASIERTHRAAWR
jgi:hypothetical protein